MAHPNKFVSVNLNKSYGRPSNPSSSSCTARSRPGAHSSAAGMVVLSRPRSSSSSAASAQKTAAAKLSVPPPLNLPSLRKENEKFDLSVSSGSSARPGSSGLVSGPGSSSLGWMKPAAPAALFPGSSGSGAGGSYLPQPTAARGAQPVPSSLAPSAAEKAVFLRGEDFPSLKATVSSVSRQKELAMGHQKERENSEFSSPLRMRPQMRPSSRLVTDGDERGSGWGRGSEQSQKKQQEEKYFAGPLPVVKLTHTSDWADDERDTGLSLPERDRDPGFSRGEFGRVQDSFGRSDLLGPNRDVWDAGSSWRMPPPQPTREVSRDSSFGHSSYGNNVRDGIGNGSVDLRYVQRDLSSEQQNVRGGRYGNDVSNNRYRGDSSSNNYQQNAVTKAPFSYGTKGLPLNDPILNFGREKKLSSSNSGKMYLGDAGFDGTDHFIDDPIAEVNMKVFKRKKEVQKQVEFHDPVRESFEAELERVQRIQEQQRQRAMEEQTRVIEIARREQEERERLAREAEERRRMMEEEAREAAWRAEQERMEAARRAEEQRIAREEEKRRMAMEEERRKEAARQKLMELEARIANRQSETGQKMDRLSPDERNPGTMTERDAPIAADDGDWEDGERMVEHITSTSSDSSVNRYFDSGSSRYPSAREAGSPFMDRGKHGNYWKRDGYDNGTSSMFHSQDQGGDFRSLRRDTFSSTRVFSRKDGYGSFGAAPMRPTSKGGMSEHSSASDDFRYLRGNRWNVGGEGDHFTNNLEVDAADFLDDRFVDGGWGSSRPRGSLNAPYAERSFPNTEIDGGFPSYGRSRHSLRQPRVLPPPSIASLRQSQSSFRSSIDHAVSSSYLDHQSRYQHGGRSEEEIVQSGYDGGYHQRVQQPRTPEVLESDVISSEQPEKDSPRCDSQSSLSVSNPPSSPTQHSHDELDEAENMQAMQSSLVEEQILSDNEHMDSGLDAENTNQLVTASSVSHGDDDEWENENNDQMQEEEEYYGEDDGYQEEEEADRDGDVGENLDLGQEFDGLESDMPNITRELGQLVLGFDEGVEVSIPIDDNSEKTSGKLNKVAQEDSASELRLSADKKFTGESISESIKIISETEKALQELVLDPVDTSTSNLSDIEPTSVQRVPCQQPIMSPVSMPLSTTSTVQPVSSSVSDVASQAEAPIRLQFGLFSGPPLIPSPVPAIQIGSIQMPLHLHPHSGTSITQMHSAQPPFFQFGQLRYPSPMSQGILPLAPQTLAFVHPPASVQYPSTQNFVSSRNGKASQGSSSQNNSVDILPSETIEQQAGLVSKPVATSGENINFGHLNEMPNAPSSEVSSRGQIDVSADKNRQVSSYQKDRHVIRDVTSRKNYRPVGSNIKTQVYPGDMPSQLFFGEKAQPGNRAPGIISASRGKRFTYTVRNAGSRSQFSVPDNSRIDSNMFQRRPRRSVQKTEFRARENVDNRQREGAYTSNSTSQDVKPNFSTRAVGITGKHGIRKDGISDNSMEALIESANLNSVASTSQLSSSDGKIEDKPSVNETPLKKRVSSLENSYAEGDIGKRNVSNKEDVEAPIQSGVVRIFNQPGIETPSDDDDFIEVRSKRQMLNDRREQREKEIKAKSKVIKATRKNRTGSQNNLVTSISNKAVAPSGGNTSHRPRADVVNARRSGFARVEASPIFAANMPSQTLPPIGTPSVKVDSEARSSNMKARQTKIISCQASVANKLVTDLSLDSKSTGVLGTTSQSLSSWSNPDTSQQVMALTQSQLDDAMKPMQFDSQLVSSISLEPTKPSASIMVQEKLFPSSGASPLNSLLAGERIQFGAVTSPTILPPVSRIVPNGIRLSGSSRSDVSKDNLTATSNDSTIFFDKDKHPDESCTHVVDPEAEAEAAASAVAVAAISSNDEIVGNRLGGCVVSDPESFSCADNTELNTSGGVTSSQEATSQSAAEECLTVSLPADLSVDTPALPPLWQPLPSPQGTSGHSLSHFPGGPHSHFPVGFDMNPIFGGPIFAFGPHDNSGGTQTQPPGSTTLGSGPLGPWPQCHSGVDSFYGPPAGFTGPYISPPGSLPGVQAPPHMVVYNHFAPVGQFGQVGLSFMGAYIPTGKQPDWKHNPISSTVGVSEGGISGVNVVSGQHNTPNMPSQLHHLAPGSPLMPMASPLAMFDMSPFQPSGDMPYQARWSHVPAPPIHSVPLTMPLHQQPQLAPPPPQQAEGIISSQYSGGLPVDTLAAKDQFSDPRSSTSVDSNRNFLVSTESARKLPDELHIVEPPNVSTTGVQTMKPSYNSSSTGNNKGPNNLNSSSRSVVGVSSEGIGSNNGSQSATSKFNSQVSQQQSASLGSQQNLHPIQRGGASLKMTLTGEWHHRRMGYQGRGHPSDKSSTPSKMKQIYVAKPSAGGPTSTG